MRPRRRELIVVYMVVVVAAGVGRGFYTTTHFARPPWVDALDGLFVAIALAIVLMVSLWLEKRRGRGPTHE